MVVVGEGEDVGEGSGEMRVVVVGVENGDGKTFFEFSFFYSFLFYAVSTCAHSAFNCSLCHTLFNLNFTHSG